MLEQPRGIRNNNPGNIDRNATKWQGMADDQSGDPRFIVFKTPQWGIRAIARLMLTYQSQYGLKTCRGLIGRWAPPGENNTSAYVNVVASAVGVDADAEVDVDSCAVMLPLVKAIITHENGDDPYPDSLVLEALHMAGIADAPPKPLHKQGPFQAQVGAGVAVIAGGAAQVSTYAPAVKGWADQLTDFTGAPIIQHIATMLLTIAGGLVLLGIAAQFLKQKAS